MRQVCEGGLRDLGGMKRETLRSPMSMPSLSNSPWILGAPQDGLALAIWRMSALVCGGDLVLRWRAPTRLPTPKQAEASPVPADDGVWFDDDQRVRPARPEMGEYDPEGAVTLA